MRSGHRQHGLATDNVRRHVGSGVTTVELLVVVCVLAILAAIVVPTSIVRHRASINDATYRAAATQSIVRGVGLHHAELIAVHTMREYEFGARAAFGCLGDDDIVLQVEGVDQKEQRVRMTVCCRPASVAGAVTCAFSSPSRSHIEEL